jgi:hypothetical protein
MAAVKQCLQVGSVSGLTRDRSKVNGFCHLLREILLCNSEVSQQVWFMSSHHTISFFAVWWHFKTSIKDKRALGHEKALCTELACESFHKIKMPQTQNSNVRGHGIFGVVTEQVSYCHFHHFYHYTTIRAKLWPPNSPGVVFHLNYLILKQLLHIFSFLAFRSNNNSFQINHSFIATIISGT